MLHSLLGSVDVTVLEYGYEIGLNWLGKFAKAIIEGVGIIGLGIIVFTIVLKAITLPLDIYQRVSMRKQNLVMKEMQPELEKLQKQYANDKAQYNQKMMELYKKNGYSMLGACLPMIFSLVILIVAFQGFRTYSQYANLAMYERMSQVYTEQVLKYAPESMDFGEGRNYFILADVDNLEEGKIVWEADKQVEIGNNTYTLFMDGESKRVKVTSSDDSRFIDYSYRIEDERVKFEYSVDTDTLNAYLSAHGGDVFDEKAVNEEGTPYTVQQIYEQVREGAGGDEATTVRRFVARIGATAAANWYRAGNDAHFLWVKNVWYPDVSYNHPIQKDYQKFQNQVNAKITPAGSTEKQSLSAVLTPGDYENLTSQLSEEMSKPNGYFILIILSIGFMVLSQFISMRSNKESNKYQTVNGQGAKSQKMMMIIMPLIYAVFAFMYSAAFSIYMVMSSVISLVTTLLANLIIDRVFKKREQRKAEASITRKYAWQMTEKEKKEKEKEEKREAKRQERANRFKNRK